MSSKFPFIHNRDLGGRKPKDGGMQPERSSIDKQNCSTAVRVDGEVLVLRCWACGTEHCIMVEQCVPEELVLMICSKRNCRMSLFLVNELTVDEHTVAQTRVSARGGLFAALARLWKWTIYGVETSGGKVSH
ncbi:MAG: hypothetical protein JOZ80_14735 [Acidobacteriaceae bacterium]|nr:hypothetical protein [Acidobacteriaceae bacterium]